jgi:hypothetical protein
VAQNNPKFIVLQLYGSEGQHGVQTKSKVLGEENFFLETLGENPFLSLCQFQEAAYIFDM